MGVGGITAKKEREWEEAVTQRKLQPERGGDQTHRSAGLQLGGAPMNSRPKAERDGRKYRARIPAIRPSDSPTKHSHPDLHF